MAEMPEVIIAKVEAIRLEPGGIYAVEAQHKFRSLDDYEYYRRQLEAAGDKYGVKFILLEAGLKIARGEVAK